MAWKQLGPLFWTDPAAHEARPLAAGSGLVSTSRSLWIVADELHHVVRFSNDGNLSGDGYRIFPGELPDDFKKRKRIKPDTECLIQLPARPEGLSLLAFPSGSKSNRVLASEIQLSADDEFLASREINFSAVLWFLDERIPDLNIEGGAIFGEKVLLFQRGNGKAGFNGIVELSFGQFELCLHGHCDTDKLNPRITEVQLPKIAGVSLTFTDAHIHDGQVYFSAAAERSSSTYEDGEVLGSVIGRLDSTPVILSQIDKVKVEGLALASSDVKGLTFFAVTDADNPRIPSNLLKVEIQRA